MYGRIQSGLGESILALPLFLLICAVASALMLIPALHAGALRELETARLFLYYSLSGMIICALIGMAHLGRAPGHGALGPLMSLFCAFVVLPIFLAAPFYEALKTTSYANAYVEMVSAITTTGAPIFAPDRLSAPLHLWRGLVGWAGGLMMWIAAAAILAPLSLGGFEVTTRDNPGLADARIRGFSRPDGRALLVRVMVRFVPLYIGLTLLLWGLLVTGGAGAFVGLMHAMAVMATSGITPLSDLQEAGSGWIGEMIMVFFMCFALSRATFSKDTMTSGFKGLRRDPELRIGLALVLSVSLVLFVRQWLGIFEVTGASTDTGTWHDAAGAFWGGFFTVLSFLTTNGMQSAWWGTAQNWSGLSAPGLVLMGLAVIGGGVATTAGGVKLLRVFALYENGHREMERLVYPSSVGRASVLGQMIQREGIFIAWVFFMLFALSLAGIAILFALQGVPFEAALTMSIAALTTTGPILGVGTSLPVHITDLGGGAKAVFVAAMVLGRLETLAIIALFTPGLWRAGL